mgnify:CR=1 FL=1
MSITELTKRVKEQSKNRTHEENVDLLKRANIIDNNGFYSENFFSKNTVDKDRKTGKAIL